MNLDTHLATEVKTFEKLDEVVLKHAIDKAVNISVFRKQQLSIVILSAELSTSLLVMTNLSSCA